MDLTHLRLFGCTCYVHIQATHRDKLEPKAVKCAFMGYSSSQKGYKCYNSHTRKLTVSRDIRFNELTPFFHKDSENNPQGESLMDTFPLPTPGELHANPPNSITNSYIDEVVSEEVLSAPAPQAVTPQSVVALRRNPARDRHPP